MMTQPVRHLFVCTNDRPEGGRPSCGARGSGAVLAALQRETARDATLASAVAVTPCGCLGPCFEGPTVVVYPEAVWYGAVTAEDAREIAESHLRGGVPVERLRVSPDEP
jgi:(2Fe-2S) ferredoxin